MLDWLIQAYGQKAHGTTGLKPYEEFIQYWKRPALQPLALEAFEAAYWKEAAVHPDLIIYKSEKILPIPIPHRYVGKKVWVKVGHNLVSVYYEDIAHQGTYNPKRL